MVSCDILGFTSQLATNTCILLAIKTVFIGQTLVVSTQNDDCPEALKLYLLQYAAVLGSKRA